MEKVLRRLVSFSRQFIDWMLVGAMGILLVVVTIGMATSRASRLVRLDR